MEASIEAYLTHYMDLKIEELLAFPLQVAEVVRKGAEEADSFRQECSPLSNKVEKLIQLLRKAARFSTANAVGLYERPTRRIMLEVLKALEKALGLVKKCRRSGMLRRVMTITTTTDFRKVNLWLDSSIGDVTWLLNISSSGDERSEFAGLPPIASTDPVLALVWEQVSIVHVGTAEEKADGAEYLGNLAKGNDRNVKIIIEEGASPPLLRLLKEGTIPGQEAAATALGHLARDKDRVRQLRTEGASSVFTHILGSHSTSMKVQLQVARVVAKFASLDEEAQGELAQQGAIRLLVALLAHQTNTVEGKEGPVSSIAAIVARSNLTQLRSTTARGLSNNNNNMHTNASDARVQPVAMAASSVVARIRSANQDHTSGRMMMGAMPPMRTSSRAHRELEDPEVKLGLKVEAAHALWKLAAGNIKNCKLITDTCALLCFAKLMKHSGGELKYNSVMAVMEIAAAAESDPELRRAAFKTNSPSAKAVVEQLLLELTSEHGEPELQVASSKAIGSLARIFPAPAEGPIRALTSALQNQNPDVIQVATEAASALSKFASDENYLHLEHSKNIIQEGAVDHLVLLALNFGYCESQLSALELLCYLSLNVPDSEALARANIIHVLKSTIHANQLSQMFSKHETARPLINDAIAKLEVYQLRSSSFSIDMGNSSP